MHHLKQPQDFSRFVNETQSASSVGLFPLMAMTTTQFLIAVFALLIGGLLLPLSSGARSGLFLALVALAVMTFLGGGMQYITSLF